MMTPQGYSRLQIGLHWGIAALILGAFLTHDGMEEAWDAVERGTAEPGGPMSHAAFGLAVLVLMLLRIGLRLWRGAPAAPAGLPPLVAMAAHLGHWGLYAVFLALPMAGAAAWIGGIGDAAEVHETLFALALLLTGVHVAAALYHQFVRRDGLMARMLRAR